VVAVHLDVRVRTYEAYEASLRVHLVPELGDLYLSEITRRTIDAFVADRLSGGPAYQERLRLAREAEAKLAKERGATRGRSSSAVVRARSRRRSRRFARCSATPSSGSTSRPTRRSVSSARAFLGRKMHLLGPDEIRRLLEKLDGQGRVAILTALTTGMRRGELFALRWGDVDWFSKRIWVRRNVRLGVDAEPLLCEVAEADLHRPPELAP
jgi:integrase